jgi:hypothetical protein
LKYAQYIERIEAGLTSNPRCFFKFVNLKQNSSGYLSAMFLGATCARNAQEIANLFGEYFQDVYMMDDLQDDFVVDDGVEDSSTVLLSQLEEVTMEQGILALDTQKGPGPDLISPLILKKIGLVVKRPFAVLFNLWLLSGVFPCVWEQSYFCSRVETREIFLTIVEYLLILSANYKPFEKLVCEVITPIIRPLISYEQHGFVCGRSTFY